MVRSNRKNVITVVAALVEGGGTLFQPWHCLLLGVDGGGGVSTLCKTNGPVIETVSCSGDSYPKEVTKLRVRFAGI